MTRMSDDPMNDDQKLKETLSALMDGEAGKSDQLELRRLARSLNDCPELVETYRRYIQVRTVISGEPAPLPASSFLANIRQAIETENMDEVSAETVSTSVLLAQGEQNSRRWLKAFGSIAVAASVAVIAVMLVQMRSTDTSSRPLPVTAQSEMPREAPDAVVAHNNRILNPNVLTVSAGNHNTFSSSAQKESSTMMSGCVLDARRSDQSEVIWEKPLPAGYALCKQNSATHHCDVVSEKVGCYLH
jgi:negative regulator of sigma E activity